MVSEWLTALLSLSGATMNASPSVFMALKRERIPGEWTPSSFVTRMTGIKTIVAECEDSFNMPGKPGLAFLNT
jgi:hypothetical protein